MLNIMQGILKEGPLLEACFTAVVTMIPKASGIPPPPTMLRPIALQSVPKKWPVAIGLLLLKMNSFQKWITNVILIQLEDILQQVVPRQQKGFVKHRSILDHIYSARAT